MDKKQNPSGEQAEKDKRKDNNCGEDNKKLQEKIDEELEESFPASDPPSYSQPGNNDIIRDT